VLAGLVAFLWAGPEEKAVVEGDGGAVFCVWAAVFAFADLRGDGVSLERVSAVGATNVDAFPEFRETVAY
jgi:hypothetical protein